MSEQTGPMLTPSDGLIIVAKRDCPTCTMLEPVYAALSVGDGGLTVYTQDDPGFPESVPAVYDSDLEVSYHLDIETVPTLIRVEDSEEKGRAIGWNRGEWEALAEAEIAFQRAGLARRVGDSDYPFPEILDHVAGVLVRDFR